MMKLKKVIFSGMIIILLQCGGCMFQQSGNYDMQLILEIQIGDLIQAMSSDGDSPEIQLAIQMANHRKKNSHKSMVQLFGESFEEISPDVRLGAYFSSIYLRDRITYNSTNDEVLDVLDSEIDDAIDREFNILLSRLERSGFSTRDIDIILENNIIHLSLTGVHDPERMRRIISTTGSLEFWETYSFPEIAEYILQAEELIIEQENRQNEEKQDSEDSAEMSTEELEKAYPLRSLLTLAVDQEGNIKNSATVGYARIQDTARINVMLANAKEVFPANLRLAWTIKPREAESDIFELVALKISTRDKRAPLTGDVIVDARQDYDASGQVQISLIMSDDGAKIWKYLTRDNIGKQLAITLDAYVYSYPFVNAEIPNGRSSISGVGDIDDAKDLATILKSGLYPSRLIILEETITIRKPGTSDQ